MFVASLLCFALLIIADLLRTNRIMLEENLERLKHLQFDSKDHRQPLRTAAPARGDA